MNNDSGNGLSRLNTLITVLTSALVLFTSVYTWNNDRKLETIKAQIQEIEKQTKDIDKRTKQEAITYTLADKFFQNLKDMSGSESKRAAVAVALLNLIVQASTSEKAESEKESRIELPLRLGLMTGSAGIVATIDRDFSKRKIWIEIPKTEDDEVRITAIKALSHICRYCASQEKLDPVIQSFSDMLELADFMESTRKKTEALAEIVKLVAYFGRHDELIIKAGTTTRDPKEAKAELDGLFARAKTNLETESTVLAAKQTSTAKQLVTEDLTARQAASPELKEEVKKTVESAQEALDEAPKSLDRVKSPVGPDDVSNLIARLSNPSSQVRRTTQSQLAFMGQSVVKPMLEEVRKCEGRQDDQSDRLRLGVATALGLMKQPILIDKQDAESTATLLGANDKDTRQNAAEFLMKLDDKNSVEVAYKVLTSIIDERDSGKWDGNAVINAAIIIGTWVRIVPGEWLSTDGRTPLWKTIGQGLERKRKTLETTSPQDWKRTIFAIKKLFSDAEKVGRKI